MLFCTAVATDVPPSDARCAAAVAEGVNFTVLSDAVPHGIHSITVENIRYFFEPSFPVQNSIPTVNTNLTGPHILDHAPSNPSPFMFPGYAEFDFILSNNDDPSAFLVNGMNTLEKLGHQLHMMDMWLRASKIYNEIKARNISTADVCPCIVDEENNGILTNLAAISKDLRQWLTQKIVDGARHINKVRREKQLTSYIYVDDKDVLTLKRSINPAEEWTVPELKDSESWKFWKGLLMKSMMSDDRIYNFAMYVYCKINM